MHDRDFIADFFFGKHDGAGQWEPYNSAGIIGERHLEAGIETTRGEEIEQGTFKMTKLFGKKDSNVIVDVCIRAKKFWPVFPDLGAYCLGNTVLGFKWAHFGKMHSCLGDFFEWNELWAVIRGLRGG